MSIFKCGFEDRTERIEFLKNELKNKFKREEFDPEGLGFTANFNEAAGKSYPAPERLPKSSHPRVLFTPDMISGIKEALENPEYSAARELFDTYLNADTDGVLGEVVTQQNLSHNYDHKVLYTVRARALAYALEGDEYYGLSALYILYNFMLTLVYNYRNIDETRDFGGIVYTAACVYDWCYDLLSDYDKERLLLGVEHIACRGTVLMPERGSFGGVKMEIGFPPARQGAITGHGCEMQLLRNFLAMSIAIYDEYPNWYEFCAGRFYSEYVEPRNIYYSAGLYPQGTRYNAGRFGCDLMSAWIMKVATGENPYNESDMHTTVYAPFASLTEIEGKHVFLVGDELRGEMCLPRSIGPNATMASFLFSDPVLRGIAKWNGYGYDSFGCNAEALSPIEFFILMSDGIMPKDDGVTSLPKIVHNGGWYGQTIIRRSFEPDSPVSLMKVQCRSLANHDHCAAGNFQIYYKGILASDMGNYTGSSYSSIHCNYFLRSSIAHNTLLIYNPALRAEKIEYDAETGRPTNILNYYYCGNQRRDFGEARSLAIWQSDLYETGKLLARCEGYSDGDTPKFAYISGDITKAYFEGTADLVRRSMLTVFTEDKSAPMLMFISDRIDAKSPDFKKTFLLQNATENPPKIDEIAKTVTINNGKGKLVLTNILGCDKIEGIGGSDDSIEDKAFSRRNHVVNGEQLHFYMENPGVTPADGETWGRVELSTDGEKSTVMTNVIQVADIDAPFKSAERVSVSGGSGVLFEGARVGGVVALFATDKNPLSESFTLELSCDSDVYIAGVAEGEWQADGRSVTVTKDDGLITLRLAKGTHSFTC